MAKRSLLAMIADEDSVTGLLLVRDLGKRLISSRLFRGKRQRKNSRRRLIGLQAKETTLPFCWPTSTLPQGQIYKILSARRDIELFNGHQKPHPKDHNQVFFLPLHKAQYAAFSVLWPYTDSAYSRYYFAHFLIWDTHQSSISEFVHNYSQQCALIQQTYWLESESFVFIIFSRNSRLPQIRYLRFHHPGPWHTLAP